MRQLKIITLKCFRSAGNINLNSCDTISSRVIDVVYNSRPTILPCVAPLGFYCCDSDGTLRALISVYYLFMVII